MSKPYATQQIRASQVVAHLTAGCNCSRLPATESQARPLTKLPPEEQSAAWQKAVETAPTHYFSSASITVNSTTLEKRSSQAHTPPTPDLGFGE